MENEELVAQIKAGIDTADNMLALWEQNRGMIGKLARRYSAYADIEDLQQEGYLALYDAIDGFKPDKGVRFLSYATTIIERKMRRYIYDNGSSVRIPEHEQAKMYEYKKMVNAFQTYLGRKPTRQEIAYNMGLSDKGVRELEKTVRMGQIASLDTPLTDENGADTLIDIIPDENNAMLAVMDDMQREELESVIWGMVDSLPGNQGAVLRGRFLQGQTLKEVGDKMGMTAERTRTMQNNACGSSGRARIGVYCPHFGKEACITPPFMAPVWSGSIRHGQVPRSGLHWGFEWEIRDTILILK